MPYIRESISGKFIEGIKIVLVKLRNVVSAEQYAVCGKVHPIRIRN